MHVVEGRQHQHRSYIIMFGQALGPLQQEIGIPGREKKMKKKRENGFQNVLKEKGVGISPLKEIPSTVPVTTVVFVRL